MSTDNWREHVSEPVLIVLGDDEQGYTCITSETRPNWGHCWSRAVSHIYKMLDVPWSPRYRAARQCGEMADYARLEQRDEEERLQNELIKHGKIKKPPRRAIPVREKCPFSWKGIPGKA